MPVTLFEAGFHNKDAFDAKVARCVNVMAHPNKTDILYDSCEQYAASICSARDLDCKPADIEHFCTSIRKTGDTFGATKYCESIVKANDDFFLQMVETKKA